MVDRRRSTKAEWAAYMREWARKLKEKDPEAYRAMVRKRSKRAKESGAAQQRQRRANHRRGDLLDAIRKHAGCADCGTKGLPPECYDFDHRPGEVKEFSVCAVRRIGLDRLLAEIEKCDVVCANCHRVRTRQRRHAEGLLETAEARPTEDHVGRCRDMWAEAEARGLLPRRH